MVTINKENNTFIFEVKGLHKFLALKRQLTIPVENILKAQIYSNRIDNFSRLRYVGTCIPSLIIAGTFYYDNKKIFCDFSKKTNCIEVDLINEEYNQLIIEVENPVEVIKILSNNK